MWLKILKVAAQIAVSTGLAGKARDWIAGKAEDAIDKVVKKVEAQSGTISSDAIILAETLGKRVVIENGDGALVAKETQLKPGYRIRIID